MTNFVAILPMKARNDKMDKMNFTGKTLFKTILFYSVISLSGLLMAHSMEWIYRFGKLNLELEKFFEFNFAEISYLVICLILFILFFSFSQFIYGKISKLKGSTATKLIGIIISVIFIVLDLISGQLKLQILPVLLSYFILIMALDLYQDRKSAKSTWVFTWMILISAFVSFLIYSIDHKGDKEGLLNSLDTLVKERDSQLENLIIDNNKEYSNYITEWKELDKAQFNPFIEKFIKLSEELYFHPLTGDYIIYSDINDGIRFTFQILYKDKSGQEQVNHEILKKPFILFYGENVLHNNLYEQLQEEFPVSSLLKGPSEEFLKGYQVLRLKKNNDISLVHISSLPGLLRPASLFSLLFFILSILIFVLSLINYYYRILPGQLDLRFFTKKSLRNRIQISIISLVIVSFFIIGLASSHYLGNLSKQTNKELLFRDASQIHSELNNKINQENWIPSDKLLKEFSLHKSLTDFNSEIYFDESSKVLADKRNIFVTDSNLLFSSVPSTIIDSFKRRQNSPPLWYEKDKTEGYFISIHDKNTTSPSGYAFLEAKKESGATKNITDIFATFLSIYSLIFILSGIIAILLANSITKPIEKLGEKLKALKLNNKNEKLEWKNKDEIGALISIYNEMIHKLSDNAKVMAKVERDSAWKEMAKQVAHEIKNPLTPLKLNIQYLESKVRMNPDEAAKLIEQISPSLIEQIDNLSEIASEFSNFAQLPTARNEKIRLNEIVRTVHDFFRKREDLGFQLFVPINDVLVFADRNHLVRILNNVVKNAIQSIPAERDGEIEIRLYRQDGNAIIKVSDNGSGIPNEMREKVFSPNFTTKSSGTGLGLAISTNMLESCNGRIFFETVVNEGTQFYIELPLMRLEDNYPDKTTVMLDD